MSWFMSFNLSAENEWAVFSNVQIGKVHNKIVGGNNKRKMNDTAQENINERDETRKLFAFKKFS